MRTDFRNKWLGTLLLTVVFSLPMGLFAKDKPTEEKKDAAPATATMKLTFSEKDSVKICTATLTAGEKPLEGIAVKFYAQRYFSLLPFIAGGKAVSTDEKGMATVNFPKLLPGDCNGSIVVIAKVEDDDNYGSLEAKDSIKWGSIISTSEQEEEWNTRSLSATGDRAPVYLLSAAGFIIVIVWGTLIYVMFSLVRIKKAGKAKK